MYYPIKYTDETKTILLLDDLFSTDEYLQYAIEHNISVKFTETTCIRSVEDIYKFVKAGFSVRYNEEKQFSPDGFELNPKVVVYFER